MMMKLLKYDWLRNSTVYYATILLYILLQSTLLVGRHWDRWDGMIVLAFSIMMFFAASAVMFYRVCKTFADHLRTFSRRLLPVKPIQQIGAVVILHLIYASTLFAVAAIAMNVLFPVLDLIKWIELPDGWVATHLISGSIYMIWAAINMLIWILVAIAIGCSFRTKYRIWLGIASFIVIQAVISWVDGLLFGAKKEMRFGGMELTATGAEQHEFVSVPVNQLLSWSTLFEAVLLVGAIYTINYLMNKKIEL